MARPRPLPLNGRTIPRVNGRARLSGRIRLAGNVFNLDLHPDTRSYRDRIYGRGGFISDFEIEAIDRLFVRPMINSGLRNFITECSLMAGENLASARTKLWYPPSIQDSLTGVNIVEGNYTKTSGIRCINSTQYLRTGYIPSANGHTNAQGHLAAFAPLNQGSSGVDIGAFNASTQSFFFGISTSGSSAGNLYSGTTGRIQVAISGSTVSFYNISRVSATDLRFFSNATQIGSTVTTTSDGSVPTVELFIGARNNLGTADINSSRTIGFYSIGRLGIPVVLQNLYYQIVLDVMRVLRRSA